MGWLKELDGAIQGRLEALEAGGRPVLRTAGPLRGQGRSSLPVEVLAAEKPAVFYAIERVGGEGDGVLARVQALVIAEDLRGSTVAWRGAAGTLGAYELAELAAQALVGPDLAGSAGAWLSVQRAVHVDARVVALLQEYEVVAAGERVLLDGRDLLGGRSLVRLTQASRAARWQAERAAGSEQCWAKWQGRGPSRVELAGTLWAGTEAELAGIEQGLETLLVDRQLHEMTVASGSWPDVAMSGWQRTGGRMARPVLGLLGQKIQIEFEQYLQ